MFKNFKGVLIVGVPLYCTLLLTMGWRANARLEGVQNLPKLLAAFGGIFFIASDALIAFNMFYSTIPHVDFLVMSTYYIAQLGISLSVLDHEVIPKSLTKSN